MPHCTLQTRRAVWWMGEGGWRRGRPEGQRQGLTDSFLSVSLFFFFNALDMKGPHRNVKFRYNETDIFPLKFAPSSPPPSDRRWWGRCMTSQMGKHWQMPTQRAGGWNKDADMPRFKEDLAQGSWAWISGGPTSQRCKQQWSPENSRVLFTLSDRVQTANQAPLLGRPLCLSVNRKTVRL